MDFRIADTFTSSLAKLAGEEQKLVKTTAFDLQMNPANPGHQFHKLDRAKDPNFWSVRVSRDIRIVVHRTEQSLMMCYVNHHDDAYRWAERRKLETHPKTGAAQIVEIRERVVEIEVPIYKEIERKPVQPPLFAEVSQDILLSYGVPEEWVEDVRKVDEDGLFALADHLPAEAAEALLELAVGGKPEPKQVAPVGLDPFEHPDAQRRFRTVTNVEELAEALDYPWEKWAIFLHPSQRDMVSRDYNGPARVSGSAGTGKTVVALHRAVNLAKADLDAKVLLTTFSPTLASLLRSKVRRLLATDPRIGERLEVADLNSVGRRLYEAMFNRPRMANETEIKAALSEAAKEVEGHKFGIRFLWSEWNEVVDAWQLSTWEEYRDVKRLGRKTRLPEAQRTVLWSIFEKAKQRLEEAGALTYASLFTELAARMRERRNPPYDYVVVDEAQDISIPQLKFLAALAGDRPNALFFAGDLGQRIFQSPFSWKSLGVDVRGRSKTLNINYRTSHQIRTQSDRLLGKEVTDVDGLVEERKGTISVFNGPDPVISVVKSEAEEIELVSKWLKDIGTGIPAHELCVVVRSDEQLDRARAVAQSYGAPSRVLDQSIEPEVGHLSLCTMHSAKGLEFRAVAVMACEDEVIPLQERIDAVSDETDLEEVYNTERHLLYVACTRARDHLLITAAGSPSEFLDDLRS